MTPGPTLEEWRIILHKYEHTDQPVAEICREHRTTPNTLRDRARRWGGTLRRVPIPCDGPPPLPPPVEEAAPPLLAVAVPSEMPDRVAASLPDAPQPAPAGEPPAGDDLPTVERMQDAVVAVLANIETIVAKTRTGRAHASENERAARALAALTRTLRELKTLQKHQEPADDTVDDIDEFRDALARKIDAFVAAHGGGVRADAEPEGT